MKSSSNVNHTFTNKDTYNPYKINKEKKTGMKKFGKNQSLITIQTSKKTFLLSIMLKFKSFKPLRPL